MWPMFRIRMSPCGLLLYFTILYAEGWDGRLRRSGSFFRHGLGMDRDHLTTNGHSTKKRWEKRWKAGEKNWGRLVYRMARIWRRNARVPEQRGANRNTGREVTGTYNLIESRCSPIQNAPRQPQWGVVEQNIKVAFKAPLNLREVTRVAKLVYLSFLRIQGGLLWNEKKTKALSEILRKKKHSNFNST